MKILSVAIPCYNSKDYMKKCIESLLVGGDEVEIIIVNDGSVDETGKIADDYAKRYPSIIKAIHQSNGGHGEAVNTGLKHATGLYFKVVDSDDWVDEEAYLKILSTLRNMVEAKKDLDMLISNYVYEKEGAHFKKHVKYTSVLPQERIFTWNDIKNFRKGQYMLMHAVIYRTQLLRDCGLKLPKHTFYVDNLFVYIPLPSVRTMYYMDVNFYRYYIGREDQSVNENIMIGRMDQQIKVNKMMVDAFRLEEIPNKKLRRYMRHYLEIITIVSSILCIRSEAEKHLQMKKELWHYIKERDSRLYWVLRFSMLGQLSHLPGWLGRKISITVYKITQRLVGFN